MPTIFTKIIEGEIPMDGVRDLDFANAAASVDREELETEAGAIRDALSSMGAGGVAD